MAIARDIARTIHLNTLKWLDVLSVPRSDIAGKYSPHLGHRVDSAEIRAFGQIAPNARPSEVTQFVSAAMFDCDNMFDLVTPEWSMLVPQPTVLATVIRSLPHELARLLIH